MTLSHLILTATASSLFTSLLWWIRILTLNDTINGLRGHKDMWKQSYDQTLERLYRSEHGISELQLDNERLRDQLIRIKCERTIRRPLLP